MKRLKVSLWFCSMFMLTALLAPSLARGSDTNIGNLSSLTIYQCQRLNYQWVQVYLSPGPSLATIPTIQADQCGSSLDSWMLFFSTPDATPFGLARETPTYNGGIINGYNSVPISVGNDSWFLFEFSGPRVFTRPALVDLSITVTDFNTGALLAQNSGDRFYLVQQTPEPTTLMLVLTGLIGTLTQQRRSP
jgi:hypothetical protein